MKYFLAKTEPGTYSMDDLERDHKTSWDGVTNPQAVKNIREMRPGDRVFIYHPATVIDKHAIARTHLANILDRLRIGHAVPGCLVIAFQVVHGVSAGFGLSEEIFHVRSFIVI